MNIISRKEAKDKGLSHYYTGLPCKNNHIDLRCAYTSMCSICRRELSSKYRKKTKNTGSKKWYKNNTTVAAEYRSEWYDENHEAIMVQSKEYRQSTWGKIKRKISSANRRAARIRAMPAWADTDAMVKIYKEATKLTEDTNVSHEVDHYYPLCGELVCGLHVGSNLCIITATENRQKGSKHPDEFYK